MKAIISSNKAMFTGLAGVVCAAAIVLGAASAGSASDQSGRTFEQEKTIALKAIVHRQELAAQGRTCLEGAQSVDQISDCLDAEYRGKAEVDMQLRPLKSRLEMMNEADII